MPGESRHRTYRVTEYDQRDHYRFDIIDGWFPRGHSRICYSSIDTSFASPKLNTGCSGEHTHPRVSEDWGVP